MDKRYTDTAAENLKKVKDAFEAWRKGAGSPFQLLKDDASWTIVGNSVAAKEYKSCKEFIDQVIAPFNARMAKPLVPAIRGIYADGDTVVVIFDAAGTAKDGKIYANTYSCSCGFETAASKTPSPSSTVSTSTISGPACRPQSNKGED